MKTMEEALSRTLAAAASIAPAPGAGFLAGVRSRQRRRRWRQLMAAVAAAVALTTGGTATAVGLHNPKPPPPDPVPTVWSGAVPDLQTARPAEEVWPEAVRRLPAKLPDGRPFEVLDVIGPDRYLVDTPAAAEPVQMSRFDALAPGPSVFDVKANTVRPLYDPAVQTEPRRFLQTPTVRAGDWAVWVGNSIRTEVWSARLDGTGGPRRLAQLGEYERIDSTVGVAGDAIYWSRESGRGSLGIFRLPLSGGEPQLLPGTEGYRPLELSPWITTPQSGKSTEKGQEPAPRKGEMWNILTGERRKWSLRADALILSCDPVLCAGLSAGGYFVQRPDGTDHQTLSRDTEMRSSREGRFGVGSRESTIGVQHFVWDRFTGKAAVTGMGSVGTGVPSRIGRGYERTVIVWPDLRGGSYLLDLKAIR